MELIVSIAAGFISCATCGPVFRDGRVHWKPALVIVAVVAAFLLGRRMAAA